MSEKIIAVVGTNASGKSSIGIELAKKYSGEIISADSRQIYRGFDLCSGKVTIDEQRQVRHHLIDVCEIDQVYSVADYQSAAYAAIDEINNRGNLPIIVGGTGLYVASVVHGYILRNEVPDEKFRNELESLSIDEMHTMLTPEARQYLEKNHSDYWNKRRVERVLEKCRKNEPLEYQNAPKYEVLQIGISWPRDMLKKRIIERLNLRIKQGMLDEINDYLNAGGNPDRLMRLGLEYKYVYQHVSGYYDSLDIFKEEMSKAIYRFAKRQMTWFKKDKTVKWVDMTADYINEIYMLVDEFLINKGKRIAK